VALVTLLTFSTSCYTWSVVPLKEVEETRPKDMAERIRIAPQDGSTPVVMRVQSFDYPNVTGVVEGDGGAQREPPPQVTFDLRNAKQVEIWSVSGWRTALLVGGIILGALAIAGLVYALTKTSCPLVYVDDGTGFRFVGEAYSGATSRATQRGDMLPLPSSGLHPVVVLSNEAWESQFTDLLEIAVVDRAPGSRALATHDAGIVLVGEPLAPRAAVDLEGADVLSLVRASDGQAWQGNLPGLARLPAPPSREGIVATFPVPPGHGPLALEMEAGNTAWLDVVFGRFFALLGDRLDRYLDEADRPESREFTLAWREREGVDLLVEVERGGRFERVAVVPTVGPAASRHFAVPIGPATGEEIRVRLSGGVGFWQADALAVAPITEARPPVSRHAPVRANAGGKDVREQFASVDGSYQVLADRGERVDISFDLPPPAPGLVRDSFLHTSGYYRVHRPPQSGLSVGTLYRLRDEPGSLSRFSLDLYRGYERMPAGGMAAAR
jgi:hypothetical protein